MIRYTDPDVSDAKPLLASDVILRLTGVWSYAIFKSCRLVSPITETKAESLPEPDKIDNGIEKKLSILSGK
ncbi:hypothetical protein TNCV_766671 [Trichonephila clavipes]|nr:hypothetical protein TNCV_766671 [Trichonephila clavipes]